MSADIQDFEANVLSLLIAVQPEDDVVDTPRDCLEMLSYES